MGNVTLRITIFIAVLKMSGKGGFCRFTVHLGHCIRRIARIALLFYIHATGVQLRSLMVRYTDMRTIAKELRQ